jgi:hypothetical protein
MSAKVAHWGSMAIFLKIVSGVYLTFIWLVFFMMLIGDSPDHAPQADISHARFN